MGAFISMSGEVLMSMFVGKNFSRSLSNLSVKTKQDETQNSNIGRLQNLVFWTIP